MAAIVQVQIAVGCIQLQRRRSMGMPGNEEQRCNRLSCSLVKHGCISPAISSVFASCTVFRRTAAAGFFVSDEYH